MYRSTFFMTSALVGGEWSTSRPVRFTPGERVPSTHWTGGWVDPIGRLDDVEKILGPTSTQTPIPSHPPCNQSLY
jgi:hypothetical protein